MFHGTLRRVKVRSMRSIQSLEELHGTHFNSAPGKGEFRETRRLLVGVGATPPRNVSVDLLCHNAVE